MYQVGYQCERLRQHNENDEHTNRDINDDTPEHGEPPSDRFRWGKRVVFSQSLWRQAKYTINSLSFRVQPTFLPGGSFCCFATSSLLGVVRQLNMLRFACKPSGDCISAPFLPSPLVVALPSLLRSRGADAFMKSLFRNPVYRGVAPFRRTEVLACSLTVVRRADCLG